MIPHNVICLPLQGYICRVRALQNENSKLCHQISTVEASKRAEITNLKDLYDKQVTYQTSVIFKFVICYIACTLILSFYTHFRLKN